MHPELTTRVMRCCAFHHAVHLITVCTLHLVRSLDAHVQLLVASLHCQPRRWYCRGGYGADRRGGGSEHRGGPGPYDRR